MAQMRIAHESGLPPMRPLFLDFPADPASWEVEDQFLFGDDILVAPVCTEGARQRRVYLPAGPAERRGGTPGPAPSTRAARWITAPAPLDTIPVYLRAGGRVEAVRPAGEPRADRELWGVTPVGQDRGPDPSGHQPPRTRGATARRPR